MSMQTVHRFGLASPRPVRNVKEEMAPSNTSKRAGQLHEHKAVIAHALRQHAGIPYEVEQKVRRLPDDSRRADGSPGRSLEGAAKVLRMEGFRYSTDVVVRFAETDAQGIAHHAAFVVWLEVASRRLAGRARAAATGRSRSRGSRR